MLFSWSVHQFDLYYLWYSWCDFHLSCYVTDNFQLEKHHSPVLRDLMMYLRELMKDYKSEIKGAYLKFNTNFFCNSCIVEIIRPCSATTLSVMSSML